VLRGKSLGGQALLGFWWSFGHHPGKLKPGQKSGGCPGELRERGRGDCHLSMQAVAVGSFFWCCASPRGLKLRVLRAWA
jgi:hypothetical protein